MEDTRNNAEDEDSIIAAGNTHSLPEEDIHFNPYQVARRGVAPFYAQLEEHVLLSSLNFTEVSFDVLKSNGVIRNRLNYKFIELQLLCIITSN